MALRAAPSLIKHDIRRTMQILEVAAGDMGDDFLQYLLGMAIIHMDEKTSVAGIQPAEPPACRDEQILLAARLVVQD